MAAHAEPPPVVCWNHLLKQACTYGRHCKREHLELDDPALGRVPPRHRAWELEPRALGNALRSARHPTDVILCVRHWVSQMDKMHIGSAWHKIGDLLKGARTRSEWVDEHAPTLARLRERTLALVPECEPRQLSNIVHGAAHARVDADDVFDAVAAAALGDGRGSAVRFEPVNVAQTAWAFATVGRAAPALFDALAHVSELQLDYFDSQELAMTAWAFATTDARCLSLVAALTRQLSSARVELEPSSMRLVHAFSEWCARELRLPEAELLPAELRERCRQAGGALPPAARRTARAAGTRGCAAAAAAARRCVAARDPAAAAVAAVGGRF